MLLAIVAIVGVIVLLALVGGKPDDRNTGMKVE